MQEIRKLPQTFLKLFRRPPRKHSVAFNSTNETGEERSAENEEYERLANRYLGLSHDHTCFIIHPYIKWGQKKVRDTNPTNQLEEAKSLIRTLGNWKIRQAVTVPLENFSKTSFFGKGTLASLRTDIRRDSTVSAVFLNTSQVRLTQIDELEKEFQVPVYDRYKIVMEILRLHAISKHAKLQVALAEIPYLWSRVKRFDGSFTRGIDFDTKRFMLQNREAKLKAQIEKLRDQRQLLRKKRQNIEYPVVAVVGYTNCGKTSLIKALTGDPNLIPRDQLFATLDVTVHNGILPSNLSVLYVDTVGFISDVPTNLIECFVATLEDALFADLILHVEDLSHEDFLFQRRHVVSTLENLAQKTNRMDMLKKIITIGNKCDVSKVEDFPGLQVSATKRIGLGELQHILDEALINETNHVTITIRIPIGGDESRWLYKNATVVSTEVDQSDCQWQLARVIINKSALDKFKHHFIKR